MRVQATPGCLCSLVHLDVKVGHVEVVECQGKTEQTVELGQEGQVESGLVGDFQVPRGAKRGGLNLCLPLYGFYPMSIFLFHTSLGVKALRRNLYN